MNQWYHHAVEFLHITLTLTSALNAKSIANLKNQYAKNAMGEVAMIVHS